MPTSPTRELTISVAMATYNGARFLQAQLDSLAHQTTLPTELVVTDDLSSDETLEILRAFEQSAPFPVVVVQNETNLGYGSNFMKAASLCRSDLIAFCDQDDLWEPSKLTECLRSFSDPEVRLCVHSADMWEGGGSHGRCPDYRRTQTFAPGKLYPLQSSYGFAMVFRRTLLDIADNQRRFQGVHDHKPMAHDQWIWFLGTVFGKVTLLSRSLVKYRQHAANLFGGVESGLASTLQSAVVVASYRARSEREASYAAFLETIAAEDTPWKFSARQGSLHLLQCAHVHGLRALLFERGRSFVRRLQTFFSMCLSGAYSTANVRSGRAGHLSPRPVYRAALKDFMVGIVRSRG